MTSPARPQPPGLAEIETVTPPSHPLHALATFELTGYRRRIENAIAYLDGQDPVPPFRADLQAALDAVLAEQESRKKLAGA
jgi:hypothetical protein